MLSKLLELCQEAAPFKSTIRSGGYGLFPLSPGSLAVPQSKVDVVMMRGYPTKEFHMIGKVQKVEE